jgi:hypothetical protein
VILDTNAISATRSKDCAEFLGSLCVLLCECPVDPSSRRPRNQEEENIHRRPQRSRRRGYNYAMGEHAGEKIITSFTLLPSVQIFFATFCASNGTKVVPLDLLCKIGWYRSANRKRTHRRKRRGEFEQKLAKETKGWVC